MAETTFVLRNDRFGKLKRIGCVGDSPISGREKCPSVAIWRYFTR